MCVLHLVLDEQDKYYIVNDGYSCFVHLYCLICVVFLLWGHNPQEGGFLVGWLYVFKESRPSLKYCDFFYFYY